VLDQSVRQSVLASGWSVLALTSTLSMADPTGSAVRQSGSGHWHVDALEAGSTDKPPAPFALDGTLAFELRVQPRGNTPIAASLTLKGSLGTDKTELAIDLAGNAASDGDAQTQSVGGTLRATRNEQAHTVALRTIVESNLAAYGLLRITVHSALNRDGVPSTSEQTLTVRDYGKGEREIWLHAAESPVTAAARTLDAHGFQRAAGGAVSQYIDQIDVQTADAHYALQQPALLATGATGNAAYDLKLVDQHGQAIHLSAALQPAGPAVQPAGDSASSPSSPCRPYWSFAVAGGSQPFALAVLSRYQWQQGWQLGVQPASSAQAIADSAGVMGSSSIASLLATLTTADPSTQCSSDGNIVAADNRALDVTGAGPLQITRVTGGVLPTNALPADPPAVAASTAGNPSFTYQERADAFAASAPPPGSTVIGAWTVDSAHAFRGEPSHTQPPAVGPQQHYFIHASVPLAVTMGDEIVQYVYLDALNPPAEIYLQFYTGDGNGEHRVFWGDDRVQTGGSTGTPSMFPLGPLPEKGKWVRLRVPATVLNLRGESITGILYGAYNGQTYWGPTTSAARDADSAPEQLALAEPAIPAGIAPGAQIALSLSQPMMLTAEIVDAQGTPVRTLFKEQARLAGYQVVLWNGQDSAGAIVSDKPYRVRFSSGGA
jgi:hypothetical protein